MPAISSKVSTKSTSERTDERMASSFFAEHGPTKTILALGCCFLIMRAVSVIGVRAMEMHSALSGNSFFAMDDHAGQHEVPMNGSLSGTSERKSSASCTLHRSAPSATSSTPEKPSSLNASRSLPTLPLPPNWPTKAGATAAMTSSPERIDQMTCTSWLLSAMAPKGQLMRHCPQATHLSWSILARPCSSEPMAFMPQASAQGRT